MDEQEQVLNQEEWVPVETSATKKWALVAVEITIVIIVVLVSGFLLAFNPTRNVEPLPPGTIGGTFDLVERDDIFEVPLETRQMWIEDGAIGVPTSSPRVEFRGFTQSGCWSEEVIELFKKENIGIRGIDLETYKIPEECYTPPTLIERANEYLIDRFGEAYFLENLVLDESSTRDGYLSDGEGNEWYTIVYEHITFAKLSPSGRGPQIGVRVSASDGAILPRRKELPDCRNKPELCKMAIDTEQAIDIAEVNGVSIDSEYFESFSIRLADKTGEGWAWYFTESVFEWFATSTETIVEINIASGNAVQTGVEYFAVPSGF